MHYATATKDTFTINYFAALGPPHPALTMACIYWASENHYYACFTLAPYAGMVAAAGQNGRPVLQMLFKFHVMLFNRLLLALLSAV